MVTLFTLVKPVSCVGAWEEESLLKEAIPALEVFLDFQKIIVGCVKCKCGRNTRITFHLKYT